MWAAIESWIFLGLCLGGPVVMAIALTYNLVKSLRASDPTRGLRKIAEERGWRDTSSEGRWSYRYEGKLDDIPFTISRARPLRHRSSTLRGPPAPATVTIPFEGAHGCFVVQRPVPSILAGGAGKMLSAAFVGLAGLALDDAHERALDSLTEIPEACPGRAFAAYASEPGHPLIPAAAAVAGLLTTYAQKNGTQPVMYVFEGELVLSARDPKGELVALIELACACHRELSERRTRSL